MNELKLSDIMRGLPGVSTVEGANLHENCMVELHRYGHSSPTTLKVASDNDIDINIVWEDGFNNQLDRTYSSIVELKTPQSIFKTKTPKR